MFLSQSLITFVALILTAITASAHPSGHYSHHHRVHIRPREVVKRRSCTAPSQQPFSLSTVSANTSLTTISPSSVTVSQTSKPTQSSKSSQPQPSVGENHAYMALAPLDATSSWSTSPSAPKPLPLSDATFRPIDLLTALPHPYVPAPDGQLSMKATYPGGSYNFQHKPLGGLSFYAPGPADVDLTTAKEVTLGYSVYFEEGFEFNKGGKLPGIYGGDDGNVSISCSGGRRDSRCMSVRLMWRTGGQGEMYTYLPSTFSANNNVCNVPPFSTCNPVYGASVGRGSYTWEAGKSTAVSMRVRLNDAGKENGELQLWANGNSVINVGGLVLRDSDAGRIRGIQMQSFFGGSTPDYASPKTQSSYMRDFTITITEKL